MNRTRYKMDEYSWNRLKRILSLVTGFGLWAVSMVFSYLGFSISNNNIAWVGAVLAFAVTVLELIFNTNTVSGLLNENDETRFGEWLLVFGGFVAYIYDAWTNILGFYAMQNRAMPDSINVGFVVPLLFGLLVATLPEPMFIWGMGWNKSNPSMTSRNPRSEQSHKPYSYEKSPLPQSQKVITPAFSLNPETLKRLRKNYREYDDENDKRGD
jgi:hypothetical protein